MAKKTITYDADAWIVVPRQITKEMMEMGERAASDAQESDSDSGGDGEGSNNYTYFRSDAYALIYAAMIKAAPKLDEQ